MIIREAAVRKFRKLFNKIRDCDSGHYEDFIKSMAALEESNWQKIITKAKSTGEFAPPIAITTQDIENSYKCKYHSGREKLTDDKCECACICQNCTPDPIELAIDNMRAELIPHDKDCLIENCNGCFEGGKDKVIYYAN